jgi:hypothetical protein
LRTSSNRKYFQLTDWSEAYLQLGVLGLNLMAACSGSHFFLSVIVTKTYCKYHIYVTFNYIKTFEPLLKKFVSTIINKFIINDIYNS